MIVTYLKPVVKDFQKRDFTGLDEEAVSIFGPALEQSRKVERFTNDKYVLANKRLPTLYEHITGGLELAKDKIFQPLGNVDGIKQIIEKFNQAFLVRDFGKILGEFSSFSERFQNLDDKSFPRKQAEKRIAAMVFTWCRLGADQFEAWIKDAPKKISAMVQGVIDDLKANANTPRSFDPLFKQGPFITMEGIGELESKLSSTITNLKNVAKYSKVQSSDAEKLPVERLHPFVSDWIERFALSHEKIKKSFVGNLVNVVDKLENRKAAQSLHDPEKLEEDPEFAKAKVLNYLKAYKGLQESTQTSPPTPAETAILNHLDGIMKTNFTEDNGKLEETHRFTDFDTALTDSPKLAA